MKTQYSVLSYIQILYMLHVLNFGEHIQFGLCMISKISKGHYQTDAVTPTFRVCLIFYNSF